jgi:tetratricopeptide (TPR) repeat protein
MFRQPLGIACLLILPTQLVRISSPACLAPHTASTPSTLPASPPTAEAELTLAIWALDRGDDAQAIRRLQNYLEIRPQGGLARYYLAEILARGATPEAAEAEFEHVITQVQATPTPDRVLLAQCHRRLEELAQLRHQPALAMAHRGIALYHLARDTANVSQREAYFVKVTKVLTDAVNADAGAARPCWYLALAWRELGQTHLVERWRQAAEQRAEFSPLTPVERYHLRLAGAVK